MNQGNNPKQKFAVRYDKSEIAYVTQFLVSPGNEEVLLDLSSGLLNDSSSPKTLPIQSRIALPWSTAERLAEILTQVVASRGQHPQSTQQTVPKPNAPVVPQATLPHMTSRQS